MRRRSPFDGEFASGDRKGAAGEATCASARRLAEARSARLPAGVACSLSAQRFCSTLFNFVQPCAATALEVALTRKERIMCFRPPTAQMDENATAGAPGAPAAPGVPGVPAAPGAPGAPSAPAAPGGPKVPSAPSAAKPDDGEGSSADFMGDAPGAKVQSCVPTLKVQSSGTKKKPFVPPVPGK